MNEKEYISSGLIEAYVLGLCSTEEKVVIETERLQNKALNSAIIKFELELESNFLKDATPTNSTIDENILKCLHSLQTPVIPLVATSVQNKKATNWLKFAAVAASVLFAISAIYNFIQFNKINNQQNIIAQKNNYSPLPISDYNVLKNPSITPVAMNGVFPHNICRCTLFWDKKTGKAYLMVHHLVPTNGAKSYQLWAMIDDKPVNIGLVNESIRDKFIELKNIPTSGVTAFTLTLEKKGGAEIPNNDEVWLYGKI